jgi:pimeloyl-ACP methyl ester carboxylesterase
MGLIGRDVPSVAVVQIVNNSSMQSLLPYTGFMTVRLALVRLGKVIVSLIVIASALFALLLLLMWREHFTVGRTTFAWMNPAHSEQQVMVWMWYPAAPSGHDRSVEYLPADWRAALAAHTGAPMRTFFKHDFSRVEAHSLDDAAVSADRPSYPIVVMRPGGTALTVDFTTLAEDLASHGHFVVGFDAPYRSVVAVGPDGQVVGRAPAYAVSDGNVNIDDPTIGRTLAMWTADARFVVDQLQRLNEQAAGKFAGRIDLQRLGAFGHSFGGATALEFCREDPRCRAAIDLDGIPFGGVVQNGLQHPLMFLLSDHSGETSDPDSHRVVDRIQSIYDRAAEGAWYLTIRRANHFSFSDQILLNSQIAMRAIPGLGRLDGRRGLAIVADYVHTFFDVELNGADRRSVIALSEKYDEIQVIGERSAASTR